MRTSLGSRSPVSRKMSALLAHGLRAAAEQRGGLATDHFHSLSSQKQKCFGSEPGTETFTFHFFFFSLSLSPTPAPFLFYLLKVFLTGRLNTTVFKVPVLSPEPHFLQMKWQSPTERHSLLCVQRGSEGDHTLATAHPPTHPYTIPYIHPRTLQHAGLSGKPSSRIQWNKMQCTVCLSSSSVHIATWMSAQDLGVKSWRAGRKNGPCLRHSVLGQFFLDLLSPSFS